MFVCGQALHLFKCSSSAKPISQSENFFHSTQETISIIFKTSYSSRSMDPFGLQGYLFEPQYSEEELKERQQQETRGISEERSLDTDVGTSCATGDTDSMSGDSDNNDGGCLCGRCRLMPNYKEQVCCSGIFAETIEESVNCICETANFSAVCLHELILQLTFVQFLRYGKKDVYEADQMTNK